MNIQIDECHLEPVIRKKTNIFLSANKCLSNMLTILFNSPFVCVSNISDDLLKNTQQPIFLDLSHPQYDHYKNMLHERTVYTIDPNNNFIRQLLQYFDSLFSGIKPIDHLVKIIPGVYLNIIEQKLTTVKDFPKRDIYLSSKEFKLLYYLIINRGTFVKSEELIKYVWGDYDFPTSNFYSCMKKLREKLDFVCGNIDTITSKRGLGYSLKTFSLNTYISDKIEV